MQKFLKDEQGILLSVEVAIFLAIAVPVAILAANVVSDFLDVWVAMYQNHIEVMCATLPIPKPAACPP